MDTFPSPVQLWTRRLLLRPPTRDDEDAYFEIASDPDYAFFGSSGAVTREGVARRLTQIVAAPWHQRPEFAIVLDGRVVGRVMLDVDRANRTAALAYGVARQHWGQGIASEAALAVVDYAFEVLRVDKVWARADPRNLGSVRVLERLGMQREGLLRGHLFRRGERVDRVYYGLLREEWEARRAVDA